MELDQETLRTLITGASTVLTTGFALLYTWRTSNLDRKLQNLSEENSRQTKIILEISKKQMSLKQELSFVYQQYSDLYQSEEELLQKLEQAGVGNSRTLKSESRKAVLGQSDRKILLTSEKAKSRIIELTTSEFLPGRD